MRSTTLLSATATMLLASVAAALPATSGGQLIMGAGGKAINWGAGALSQVGTQDDTMHTMTRWDWSDCGEPTDVIQIKSVSISPDPPQPGKNLTVYASGTVSELVDAGAYADVTVKLGLIKLLTKRFDVCEELDNANSTLQCPIKRGEYSIEQTVALPAEIPRARFVVNANVFTQNDLPAACVNLWINFLLPDAAH